LFKKFNTELFGHISLKDHFMVKMRALKVIFYGFENFFLILIEDCKNLAWSDPISIILL